MLTIVRQCPPTSAVARAVDAQQSAWGIGEHLAALTLDELRVANWQRANGKKQDYPKPVERPGVVNPDREVTTFGSEPVSIQEMNDFLGWDQEMHTPPTTDT